MTSTPVDVKAQKIAIATDATWDTENQFSVENQINQDRGASLGSSLKDVVDASKDPKTNTTSTSAEAIPTGIDAIKAAGPQSKELTVAYSEH